jgi:hypothetical protein
MPYGDLPWEAPKSVLAISQEIIGRKATTGDGVIVGRAGAYIHRDQDDILKVFLVAQESLRVAETPESLGLSPGRMRESAQADRHQTGRRESIRCMDTIGGSWALRHRARHLPIRAATGGRSDAGGGSSAALNGARTWAQVNWARTATPQTTDLHNCGLESVFADRTVSAPPPEA